MKNKQHETPEFQVIRQNEANAKFFVASYNGEPSPDSPTDAPVVNNYSVGSTSGWF